MPIGTATETVIVTSEPQMIRTQAAKIGVIIDNTNVLSLPLNGRNFTQLAQLAPGVATSGGGGGQQGGEGGSSGFSSNGQRSTSNNFMVDGIDNNNYLAGAVALIPSIDSVEEFEVQTNTMAFVKYTPLGDTFNLELRVEIFDLLNTTHFAVPQNVFTAPNFGIL